MAESVDGDQLAAGIRTGGSVPSVIVALMGNNKRLLSALDISANLHPVTINFRASRLLRNQLGETRYSVSACACRSVCLAASVYPRGLSKFRYNTVFTQFHLLFSMAFLLLLLLFFITEEETNGQFGVVEIAIYIHSNTTFSSL